MESSKISIYPLGSRPCGFSYGEWSREWWKWLLSIPRSLNPAFDSTGVNSYQNQERDDVIFLCQTLESSIPIPQRQVNIRKCSGIFMPIINWVSVSGIDGLTDKEMLTKAREQIDVVGDLRLTINDETLTTDLKGYRSESPFFNLELPQNNILDLPAGVRRFVSDGYWVFLRPLDLPSKISSFGSCSSGRTKIGAYYDLEFSS
jgi:hypothetical protein